MRISAIVLCAALIACASPRATSGSPAEATRAPQQLVADPVKIVDSPQRPDADRALDVGRRPGQTLAFLAPPIGGRVAELGAGGGYTTELLALAVGPTGVVYGQNSPMVLAKFAGKPWGERLQRPELANVVRLDRDFDDPLPEAAQNLDLVVSAFTYHDLVWMKVDRDRMNRAVFKARAPGGRYVILDHQSRPGAGLNDVQTFHRIEKQAVIDDLARAGFRLAQEAEFLRNPHDAHDWNDSPREAGTRRGTSDRFVLAFVKQ